MCTVTYLPLTDGFVLTSSRDEKLFRPTVKPKEYYHNNDILVYPKDTVAGGTWIAASNKKQIACLLNGGFKNHEKQASYSKSRGLILLDSFGSHIDVLNTVILNGVEPFTLLLIDYEDILKFHELVWDGNKKHIGLIESNTAQIWSSATLYSAVEQDMRKSWFAEWLAKYREHEYVHINKFHTETHCENKRQNILMSRDGALQTVSITQIIVRAGFCSLSYYDLQDQSISKINLTQLQCTQDLQ